MRIHAWSLAFAIWLVATGLFISPLLSEALGIEGYYSSILLMVLLYIPFCIAYPLVNEKTPIKPYRFKLSSKQDFVWAMVIGVAISVVGIFIFLTPWSSLDIIDNRIVPYPLWVLFLGTGLFISIVDELFLRDALHSDYRGQGVSIGHAAAAIAIISTIPHSGGPLLNLLFMIGLRFMWVFTIHFTKSILPAILQHIIINVAIIVFFSQVFSFENMNVLRIIFGVLSAFAVVAIYLGLKSMKANHAKDHPEDLIETPKKSFWQVFNWLFWVFVALLIFMQFIF